MKKNASLRKSILLGLSVLAVLFVYAYGFDITKVSLEELRSPQRQQSLARVTRALAELAHASGPAGLVFSDGYAAANRGISSLTATWARIGAPAITVNELMLGLFDTRHGKGTRGWQALAPAERQRLLAHTLLARTGRPEEAARAVLFLIREAEYMTGSILRLDGGYVLGGDGVPEMPGGVL